MDSHADATEELRCKTCGGSEGISPKHIGYLICAKCYRFDGCSRRVSPMVKPDPPCLVQLGSQVTTPNGIGTVVVREPVNDSCRWGVDLVDNPFLYSPVYYWSDEIEVVEIHVAAAKTASITKARDRRLPCNF